MSINNKSELCPLYFVLNEPAAVDQWQRYRVAEYKDAGLILATTAFLYGGKQQTRQFVEIFTQSKAVASIHSPPLRRTLAL